MARLDSLMYAFYLKAAGLFGENEPAGINMGPAVLMNSSVAAPASSLGDGFGSGMLVSGRYYHAIQISGVASGDTINVEATMDAVPTATTVWVPISAPLTGAVNGIFQFVGLFGRIRARRTAGTGTATRVTLVSRA